MSIQVLPVPAAPARRTRDPRAKAIQLALQLAADADRLQCASVDELRIAAVFISRALAPFCDVVREVTPRQRDALLELDAAGRAIGRELQRRSISS